MIFATLNRKREDFKGHVKTVLVCSIFKKLRYPDNGGTVNLA